MMIVPGTVMRRGKMHSALLLLIVSVYLAGVTTEELCDSPCGANGSAPVVTGPRAGEEGPGLQRTPIYVGGMLPAADSVPYGRVDEAILAAIEHINNMDGLLDGYHLRIIWNWTEGEPSLSLRLLHDFVYLPPSILMTWGPMFSRAAVVVNEVAAKYNIIQATMANSPTLLDESRFPLTIRCGFLEDALNQPRVDFVKEMGWMAVAIVFEDIEYFRSNSANLRDALYNEGITVLAFEAVKDNDQYGANILSLKLQDARIIFAHFYEESASMFFCQVYKTGTYGPDKIWIMNGWINDGWWRYNSSNRSPCSSEELEEVLQYHIAFHGYYQAAEIDSINYGGIKPVPDQVAYIETLLSEDFSTRDVLSQSYDVMFVIAMALNSSIVSLAQMNPPRRLEDFTYEDALIANQFMECVKGVEFYGVTSDVSMDDNAARTEESLRVLVKQFQNTSDDPMKHVLYYEPPTAKFVNIDNASFVWYEDRIPVHGITYVYQDILISWGLRIAFVCINSLGVILAIFFVFVNVHYRNRRAIKISSPQINNMTAIGGLLLYAFIFVNSFDSRDVSDATMVILCHIETCLLAIGFSLAFGALFMKTFRIHKIFTKAVTKLQKVELPDRKLIMGACVPVIVDIAIIVLLLILGDIKIERYPEDPVEDMDQPGKEVFIVPTRRICWSESQVYFVACFYVAKGILLMFGIFLAWETRRITVAELNDSKYLAMSVYIVAVTVAITVPVLSLSSENVDFNYALLNSSVFIATTAVLCLVFLPKVILFWTTRDRELAITMMKMGYASSTLRSFRQADSRIETLSSTLKEKIAKLEALRQESQMLKQEVEARQTTEEMTG